MLTKPFLTSDDGVFYVIDGHIKIAEASYDPDLVDAYMVSKRTYSVYELKILLNKVNELTGTQWNMFALDGEDAILINKLP